MRKESRVEWRTMSSVTQTARRRPRKITQEVVIVNSWRARIHTARKMRGEREKEREKERYNALRIGKKREK